MIYKSILETVGDTPIVELTKLGAPKGVRIFGKLESFNPMSSVKDRLALAVIERAERDGTLKPGQTVVEATSGNTGIGLAMVCAAKGYPLVVTMAESFSVERRRLMRFLGAKVVLTPAAQKGTGMYLKAVELAETHGWFLTRQFENEANADIHTATTGPEIIRDFAEIGLDYFVTVFGTGGTLKGVARALRAGSPKTKVVVVEPENAQLLGGGVAQPASTGPAPASHPKFQPHPIQGTSPDFISKLTAEAIEDHLVDQILPIPGADAMRLTHELARNEGVFVGISAGAAVAAALKLAQTAPEGSTILAMLPDTGERYLSTPLFAEVPTEMTDEEIDISRSTPSAQFGVPSTPAPAAAAAAAADDEAIAAVDKAAASAPVVLFALEWCEFCWSMRNFFAQVGLPYTAVELDSGPLLQNDLGARMRRALKAKTGLTTIPQLFVGGEFVGGCLDGFDAWTDGTLAHRLREAGVTPPAELDVDPYEHLPKWLQNKPKPQPAKAPA